MDWKQNLKSGVIHAKISAHKGFFYKYDKLINKDKETQHKANLRGIKGNGVVFKFKLYNNDLVYA